MALLLILFPLMLVLGLIVGLTSKGGVFFIQERIGKNGIPFSLLKFRSMKPLSDKARQITVGDRDPRITKVGYLLRKSKMDELPQLINILGGSMSFIGPRPEVPRYVKLYSEEQKKVLSVRPGLTDIATLEYIEESELLSKSSDPEKTYIEEVMPAKLKLQLEYVENRSLAMDINILMKTAIRILQTLARRK
ncbi:MAG: sugar transferase [Flavobacteriales bacterium]|nr:sugar transferase [Flavobacteriales bacterium]